jgi:hypothetical protein
MSSTLPPEMPDDGPRGSGATLLHWASDATIAYAKSVTRRRLANASAVTLNKVNRSSESTRCAAPYLQIPVRMID